MKKKQSVIALLMACALMLTACSGGSSTENFADNARSSIAASTPAAETSTPAAAASTPAAETSAPAAEASTSAGTSAGAVEMDGVVGIKTANVYTNEFFDISLEMPDANWGILNDEQLSQQLQIVQAVLDDNGVKNLMDQGGVYYDLYAINQQTNDNVNITLQKIPFGQGATLDNGDMEETLLNLMGTQLVAAYEQMGLKGATYEVGTINFCGEEKKALFSEVAVIKQCVVILVEGDYFAAISTTSGTGEHQSLMESFTKAQ